MYRYRYLGRRVLQRLEASGVEPGVAAFVTPDRDAVAAPFSARSANALAPE